MSDDDAMWEALWNEGRVIMTQRMLEGWTMLPESCSGSKCEFTPLMQLFDGPKECVVCSGSGSGTDGCYAVTADDPEVAQVEQEEEPEQKPEADEAVVSPVDMSEEEFERKHAIVSREIGRRMLEGWKLLDTPCSECVMPLMAEVENGPEICILCGPIAELESKKQVKEEEAKKAQEAATEKAMAEERERLAEKERVAELERQAEKCKVTEDEIRISREAKESRVAEEAHLDEET